jgi:hypothetical protein
MSVKRTKDPAGLLPDRLRVDWREPAADDCDAIVEILESATPRSRIQRLRQHAQLHAVADKLAARLGENGSADPRLLDDIAAAERAALYLAAAPAVIEKRRRKARSSALTDDDIRAALASHESQAAAADQLGISDRQLRNRIKKLNRKS